MKENCFPIKWAKIKNDKTCGIGRCMKGSEPC